MTASSTLPSAQQLVDLAHKAGLAILDVYETDFEVMDKADDSPLTQACLLYTSPSPRDQRGSRMPSSA